MQYIASLKVGQNDVKALHNLDAARKRDFCPLLTFIGNQRHLTNFLTTWGAFPYMMDVSRAISDVSSGVIHDEDLHNPTGNFSNKRAWLETVKEQNDNLVPVVSWSESDGTRETVQLAIALERDYETVAIRAKCPREVIGPQLRRVESILDAVSDPSKFIVVLDFVDQEPSTSTGSNLERTLDLLYQYSIGSVCLLSSSFPTQKPPSGSTATAICREIIWQLEAKDLSHSLDLIYGDYAGFSPTAATEYIAGMAVIPFASYYTPNEWWLKRLGRDKEFENYVALAREILDLPGYHGDGFCWATSEYSRIARTGEQYGNNGVWNGFRANQHICATLLYLNYVAEDDELSIDDLI